MFSFFKRAPQIKNSLSFIGADMHNHLLPGIDDGSPEAATSLGYMDVMMQLGFQKFICTPHIISDVHPNTPQTIGKAFEILSAATHEHSLNCGLGYAAEYMVSYDFDELLNKETMLSFGDGYVLIEMSYAVESPNIKEAIFNLQTKGYKPVLAHPERYNYYHRQPDLYEELLDHGIDMQLNLLSLTGYYGKSVKAMAEKLVEKDMFSWVGTDLHHERHLAALVGLANDTKALKMIQKIKNLKNPGLL